MTARADVHGVCTSEPPGSPARETERKIGRRILRAGQIVKITGLRGDFRILHFDADEVSVYGGTAGHEKHRTFTVDRIGRRPRHRDKDGRR